MLNGFRKFHKTHPLQTGIRILLNEELLRSSGFFFFFLIYVQLASDFHLTAATSVPHPTNTGLTMVIALHLVVGPSAQTCTHLFQAVAVLALGFLLQSLFFVFNGDGSGSQEFAVVSHGEINVYVLDRRLQLFVIQLMFRQYRSI